MRVVSGRFKGRPLKAVPGMSTRPTSDKVKEAVFHMIGPTFSGGIALDLFGGSGGLGIEALSRGMDKVIFVDKDKKAIETIYRNLAACGLKGDSFEVYRNEAGRALKAIMKREVVFDLIFLDPPYHLKNIAELIENIFTNKLLATGGTIVAEHSKEEVLPKEIGTLVQVKQADYGNTIVSIYESKE